MFPFIKFIIVAIDGQRTTVFLPGQLYALLIWLTFDDVLSKHLKLLGRILKVHEQVVWPLWLDSEHTIDEEIESINLWAVSTGFWDLCGLDFVEKISFLFCVHCEPLAIK